MTTRHRDTLRAIARRAMLERGLEPDLPREAAAELARIAAPAAAAGDVRDLRARLWCSIDNDDSRDLDQLSVAEPLGDGRVKILVAVADVDGLVARDTALDGHAAHNTTSVYTAGGVFPMLPEKLSTDLTSLNPGEDRAALVVDVTVSADGIVGAADVYRALVHNHAKLAYEAVGTWLEGKAATPPAASAVPGMDQQLRLQDEVAQALRAHREAQGALTLETIEPRAVFDDGRVADLSVDAKNRARDLVEDFMVAANGAIARYLHAREVPSMRRVLRSPERWQRIVDLARDLGFDLPGAPDARALEAFLVRQRAADPDGFPDVSLSVVKLIGRGEYAVQEPGDAGAGHFGLAVQDYTHSTAPNRRYPDLVTHRLVKAALARAPQAYTGEELSALARHCTRQQDAAAKVERQVRKSAAALLLQDRVGETFDGVVTGAAAKGTWVRIRKPPIEGRVVHGYDGLDVGDTVRVKLVGTDVDKGFIDFVTTRGRKRR